MARLNAQTRFAFVTVLAATMLLLPACDRPATETEPPAADATTSAEPTGVESRAADPAASAAQSPATLAPGPPAPRPHEVTSTGLSSGGAQMRLDRLFHDFGVVWDVQSNLRCEFNFTNTGTATLEIVDVKADCGCTVPELAKRRYDPGERGVIKVAYSPKGWGPQEKFINLVTNVGGQGISRVAIRSDAKRFAAADPPSLQFDPARVGVPHRAVVTIECADPEFEIQEVWTTTGSTHATGATDFLEARLIEDTSPPQLEIVLTEEAPWGVSFAMAHLSGSGTIPNGEKHDFQIHIRVKAELRNELRADRSYYTLKLIPPGASFEQSRRLWRESGEPFSILSVEVRNPTMPGTKIEARPITDGDLVGYDLVLSGETGSYVGPVRGSVIIKTDVPGEEELEMGFSGLVQEANK